MENNEASGNSEEQPRLGWDVAFEAMAAHGDDTLLDEAELQLSLWDESEWKW